MQGCGKANECLISSGNRIFGRAFWDKFPESIFDNFEIARVKQGQFQNFQKSDYWIITPNQQRLCIETNIF